MFLKSLVAAQSALFQTQVTVAPGSSTTVDSTETTQEGGSALFDAVTAADNASKSGGVTLDPSDPESLATLGDKLLAPLTVFAVLAAIGSLIVIAIRIMFARATGDVDGAKKSSNGIGWIIGALVLVLAAPALIAYFLTQVTT